MSKHDFTPAPPADKPQKPNKRNPLGKLGGLAGKDNSLAVLSYFQALGAAVEGTYTAGEAEPRDQAKVKPIIRKPVEKK